jgi:hypothetical protein
MPMIPWIHRLNAIAWVCTTQCCDGEGHGQIPHVDFRSALTPSDTLDLIRRHANDEDYHLTLDLGCNRCRYCVYWPNGDWQTHIKRMCEIFESA